MIFNYKGIEYKLPSSLAEITLGQRIEFYQLYGKMLDEMAAKVETIADPFEQECEFNMLQLEIAMHTFAFYTGIELKQVKQNIDLASMLNIYSTSILPLYEQEKNITLQTLYEFEDQQWELSQPELFATSKMSFTEFIHAKEITRQLHAVGMGKWDALPYLCAIYLRKVDEPFSEEFTPEGSERMQLMLKLPLDIALAVGFFLSSTLNIYTTISPYSKKEELKESILNLTSTDGAG